MSKILVRDSLRPFVVLGGVILSEFGRTEQGFRGTAPNMHSAFVRTNALLAVPLRGRYDKDQLYRMGYQSYSHVREKADLYKHKSISVFADDHISFCYEIELNTRSVDRYPGPLGVTRSGRFGDCNKDNSILTTSSRTKHIIVLNIFFTSLSDVLYELMFCCARL